MPDDGPAGSNDLELAHLRWERDQAVAEAHRAHDRKNELMDAVDEAAVKTGESTIRWAILINGGAAAGLLTFLASLETHREQVARTLVFFALGALVGGLSLGCGYLANFYSGRVYGSREEKFDYPYVLDGKATPKYRFRRDRAQLSSIGLFVISMLLFVVGIWSVKSALTGLGDRPSSDKPVVCFQSSDKSGQ